jgi:small subunit ribosomal protein S13
MSEGVVRIAGKNIILKKHACISLQAIFGIGYTTAVKICLATSVDPYKNLMCCTEQQIESIRQEIRSMPHEGYLRKKMVADISRLIRIKSYVGKRLKFSLPVHGQRTRSNSSIARKRNSSLKNSIING